MKTCSKCQKPQNKTNFYYKSKSKDKLDSWCKDCSRECHRTYSKNNKSKMTTLRNKWAKENPLKEKNLKLKKSYGITLEQFNAILAKQNFSCAVCERKEDLCVDHCHVTKVVRGILCSGCNKAAGFLKDDPKLCEALGNYLISSEGLG